MLQRAARNAYSWWWASHVRSKQSKWLEQNLQDMEEKVDYILQIIDEDGDTFAKRAEMYYLKRPEIVNFVEDAFRGYRALAERYDHLSKDLQSANRTIASVYPERVQLAMEDNDDFDVENFPGTTLPSHEFNKLAKHPPAAPKLSIPKSNPSIAKKNLKMPSRLMSKKGLLKMNTSDAAVATLSSGLSKPEALQRIDKLQKGILALQTEKEFVKSSYESGLEKYWDIEKQITEMQEEVGNIQDMFGIGIVIEDDEARTLMTVAALRSCQETLTRLQQKQDQAAEDAQVEFQKIQEAREKFKTLKEKFSRNQIHEKENLEKNKSLSPAMELNKLDQEVVSAEPKICDVESLRAKIKEELQVNLGDSLTVSELAEKVDELVDKIINLESAVSSQSAYVTRLRSEANELHNHLQCLEEEKETLIEGSFDMSNKIRELEEELQRVQSHDLSIKEQNNHLQTRFVEASCNLADLTEKLENVKPDEEAENDTLFDQATEGLGFSPVKKIQMHERAITNNVADISGDVNGKEVEQQAEMLEQNTLNVEKLKNVEQTGSSSHVAGHLRDCNVKATLDANQELGFPETETTNTPRCGSLVSDGKTAPKEANKVSFLGDCNSRNAVSANNDLSSQEKSEVFTSGGPFNTISGARFRETKDEVGPGHDSAVTNDIILQEEAIEQNLWNSSTSEKFKVNSSFQSRQQITIDSFPTSQVGHTPNANPQEGFNRKEDRSVTVHDIQILKARIEDEEEKGDDSELRSSKSEKENSSFSNHGSSHKNPPMEGPSEVVLSGSADKRIKEQGDATTSCHDLFIERDMAVQARKEDFISSNRDEHIDGSSLKARIEDEEEKGDDSELRSSKSEKERFSNHGSSHKNPPMEGPSEVVLSDSADKRIKAEGDATTSCHDLFIERDMAVQSRKEDFISSNQDEHIDGYSLNVRDLLDTYPERLYEIRDTDVPSEGTKMKDDEKKSEIIGQNTVTLAEENYSRSQTKYSGDQLQQTVVDRNTSREGEENDIYANLLAVKPSGSPAQPNQHTGHNGPPENVEVKNISEISQPAADAGIAVPDNMLIVSRDVEAVDNLKKDSVPDQGRNRQPKKQNVLQTTQSDLNIDLDELGVEEDDSPNWKRLFLSGLDDREMTLLEHYTSTLRNYKEARKKLNEVEKKKRASLFQYCIQIEVLRSANASKDAEIQSLQKKLSLLQENQDRTSESKDGETTASFQVSDDQSSKIDQTAISDLRHKVAPESRDTTEESTATDQPKVSYVEEDGCIQVINVDEPQNFSIIEGKIRTDIDEVLEENIEFWMKFSSSFHQIQKFQTTVQDLQAEITKLKGKKQQDEGTNHQSLISDIRPIYRHLSEIQNELTLWLDHNVVLKDDLQNRFSSLSSIQDEITRLSNAGSTVEVSELSDYQAAKFQGEVLTMKQENNKVANELQLGLQRVRTLQVEIERTLRKVDEQFGISPKNHQSRYTAVRSRIPLRSFLFGVKLKKQKPSFFACMSPALQKQYSDLTFLQK